jgi:hypothetical protein
VAKAMAKAPEDRYGSCRDLIVDFRDEVEGRPGPRERPPPAGLTARRSRRTLGLVAAVLLLAVVAGGFLYFRGQGDELATSFTRDELVPFSFRYPEGWQQEVQGNQEVFSPHAGELLPFFISLGGDWPQVSALADRAPSETVGLYTFFNGTRMDGEMVEEIQAYLKPFLPREASFSSAHDRLVVGGYSADRLEGDLREPGGQSAVLRFQCYVVHAVPDGRTVYLVFFSSADTFEDRRALFERITKSVDFLT